MAQPTGIIEVAFATDPGAAPTWVDITSYCRVVEDITRSGRQYELDLAQPGTMTMLLDNRDRRFEPEYAASPYYPNVVPVRRVRVRTTSPTSNLFAGDINDWAARWTGPTDATAHVQAVDGFEALAIAPIVSTPASLTVQGTTFTAKSHKDGENISLEFLGSAPQLSVPPRVGVFNRHITYTIGTDSTGALRQEIHHMVDQLLGDSRVSALVDIEITDQNYSGLVVVPMAPTFLSGATYVEELTGTRMTRILDDALWPAGDRLIDAGQSMVPSSSFSLDADQRALPHALDVANSELGLAFMDGAGKFVFHDRHRRLQPPYTTAEVTFGDGGGSELPYTDLTPQFDKERIKNVIRLSRPEDNYIYETSDSASKTRYRPRPLSRSALLASDIDLDNQADWLLQKLKDPHQRVSAIRVMPGFDTTFWTAVLGLEISDRVTVKRRPPGGGTAISIDCHVERIRHTQVGRPEWSVEFELSPAEAQRYWILGDATYGVLGTTTRLAV